MRKAAAVMTAVLLLTLCSCSGNRDAGEQALDMRAELLGAEKLGMNADIRADYGGEVFDFSVKYEGSSSSGTLTITAPEEIAGLTARVSVDEASIVYDGAELATGDLTGDGLSPAEALPVMLEQWKTGYIEDCGYARLGEADTFYIKTAVSDEVGHMAWFDRETLLPVRGELYRNGRMIILCEFADVTSE